MNFENNRNHIVIGIIGSGQLARMIVKHGLETLSSIRNYSIRVYGEDARCFEDLPSVEFCYGKYTDRSNLELFIDSCDVVTWDREDFDFPSYNEERITVIPDVSVLDLVQNKSKQKQHYSSHYIDTAPYVLFENKSDLQQYIKNSIDPLLYPFIIKLSCGGFDGRGVWKIDRKEDMDELPDGVELVLEKFIKNPIELSVVVVWDSQNRGQTYEVSEMVMDPNLNLLRYYSRSGLHRSINERATELALKVAKSFRSPGVYAVELFYESKTDALMVNETSARVHNSGHHTIDVYNVSQFEALSRILIDIPVPTLVCQNEYLTYNVLGDGTNVEEPHIMSTKYGVTPYHIRMHDYCKQIQHYGRKMGHVTIVGPAPGERPPDIDENGLWVTYRKLTSENAIKMIPKCKIPIVGIVMGSKSDYPVMEDACEILDEAGVPYEVTVVSAHRTPGRLVKYAKSAFDRGLKVIIAGAGGAAHLPGMVASETILPVIGVPVKTSTLNGVDSLYSIVQMPRGVPVACMAINGSKNAALFALRILGCYRFNMEYASKMKEQVHESILDGIHK